MTVAELILALSRLDPGMPVVMEMYAREPLGDYEVLNVRTSEMQRADRWLDNPKVWDAPYDVGDGQPVAVLGYHLTPRAIIDVELPGDD
jgi:hypothetical protein